MPVDNLPARWYNHYILSRHHKTNPIPALRNILHSLGYTKRVLEKYRMKQKSKVINEDKQYNCIIYQRKDEANMCTV